MEKANGDKDVSIPETFKMINLAKILNEEEALHPKIDQKEANQLKVQMNFRNPVKDYSVMFMMRNNDLSDVRVYEMSITVLPRVFKAVLEFQSPATIEIKQEIPVTNGTMTDATFEIEKVDESNGHHFKAPTSILVKADSTQYLPVVFKPEWVQKSLSSLTITNPNTKEKFQYQLKGRGLEPLSEDHYKFNVDVGSCKSHLIKLENKEAQDIEYQVKIDMHGISGSKNLLLKAGKTANYQLQISPSLGGIYAGCVTFTDVATQRYIWYSMELESKGQKNIQSFEISSVIRKEVTLDIPIMNPYNENIEYHVKIEGQHISGPPLFRISSRSTETYRLTYLPLSTDL